MTDQYPIQQYINLFSIWGCHSQSSSNSQTPMGKTPSHNSAIDYYLPFCLSSLFTAPCSVCCSSSLHKLTFMINVLTFLCCPVPLLLSHPSPSPPSDCLSPLYQLSLKEVINLCSQEVDRLVLAEPESWLMPFPSSCSLLQLTLHALRGTGSHATVAWKCFMLNGKVIARPWVKTQ